MPSITDIAENCRRHYYYVSKQKLGVVATIFCSIGAVSAGLYFPPLIWIGWLPFILASIELMLASENPGYNKTLAKLLHSFGTIEKTDAGDCVFYCSIDLHNLRILRHTNIPSDASSIENITYYRVTFNEHSVTSIVNLTSEFRQLQLELDDQNLLHL